MYAMKCILLCTRYSLGTPFVLHSHKICEDAHAFPAHACAYTDAHMLLSQLIARLFHLQEARGGYKRTETVPDAE